MTSSVQIEFFTFWFDWRSLCCWYGWCCLLCISITEDNEHDDIQTFKMWHEISEQSHYLGGRRRCVSTHFRKVLCNVHTRFAKFQARSRCVRKTWILPRLWLALRISQIARATRAMSIEYIAFDHQMLIGFPIELNQNFQASSNIFLFAHQSKACWW